MKSIQFVKKKRCQIYTYLMARADGAEIIVVLNYGKFSDYPLICFSWLQLGCSLFGLFVKRYICQ